MGNPSRPQERRVLDEKKSTAKYDDEGRQEVDWQKKPQSGNPGLMDVHRVLKGPEECGGKKKAKQGRARETGKRKRPGKSKFHVQQNGNNWEGGNQ